jgi:hypothetical protein
MFNYYKLSLFCFKNNVIIIRFLYLRIFILEYVECNFLFE